MASPKEPLGDTSRIQLGIVFKPKNLLRAAASLAPGTGPLLEIQSQIDGAKVERRIEALEGVDLELERKLLALEKTQPKSTPAINDWPSAVGEYVQRSADLVVLYDGAIDGLGKRGRELFLAVAHACFVAPGLVLTCIEALELAKSVAARKEGRLVICAGYGQYQFTANEPDQSSGLVTCSITKRDDEKFEQIRRKFESVGVSDLSGLITVPLESQIRASVTPWLGQEVAFLHAGEATDVAHLTSLCGLQFDSTTISHFRKVDYDSLKSFVSGVLPGRVMKCGSAVFTRSGVLVGVISDTDSFPSDAGRRIIVKSLLGHPLFTKQLNKH